MKPRSSFPSSLQNVESDLSFHEIKRRLDRLEKKVDVYEKILGEFGIESSSPLDDEAKMSLNMKDMNLLSVFPFKGKGNDPAEEIPGLSLFGESTVRDKSVTAADTVALPKTHEMCLTVLGNYYRMAFIEHPAIESRHVLYDIANKYYVDKQPLTSWESFLLYISLAIGRAITGESNKIILKYYNTSVVHLQKFFQSIPCLLRSYNDRNVNLRMQMQSIEALLLVSSFGLLEPIFPGIWYIISTAMRLCKELELYKESVLDKVCLDYVSIDPKADQGFPRRLFWTCYTLDRQICCYSNKPFSLNDVDITSKMIDATDSLKISCLTTNCRKLQSMIHQFIYRNLPLVSTTVEQWRQGMHIELNNWLAEVLQCYQSDNEELQDVMRSSVGDFLILTYFGLMQTLYGPTASRRASMSAQQYEIPFASCKRVIDVYSHIAESGSVDYKYLSVYGIYQSGLAYFYCVINCPELSIRSGILDSCTIYMDKISNLLASLAKSCPPAKDIDRTLHQLYLSTIEIVQKRLTDPPKVVSTSPLPREGATYLPFASEAEDSLQKVGAIPLLSLTGPAMAPENDDDDIATQILKGLNFEDLNIPEPQFIKADTDFHLSTDNVKVQDLWEFLYEEPFSLKTITL